MLLFPTKPQVTFFFLQISNFKFNAFEKAQTDHWPSHRKAPHICSTSKHTPPPTKGHEHTGDRPQLTFAPHGTKKARVACGEGPS